MNKYKKRCLNAIMFAKNNLGFLTNCFGGNEEIIQVEIKIHQKYLNMLERKKKNENKY